MRVSPGEVEQVQAELGLAPMQALRHIQSRRLARELAMRARLDNVRAAAGSGSLDSPPGPAVLSLRGSS